MRARGSFVILPCICVLALAASGCGGGGGAKYSGASPDSWAATVCGALSDWAQGLQADSRTLGSGLSASSSIKSVKARFVVFLKNARTSAETMIDKIHNVGPPAVKDGAAIQRDLEAGLRQARASLSRAEEKAKKLPTSDLLSFSSAVTALGGQAQKELTATGDAFEELDKYDNDALNKATSEEPACRRISARS
jgi:hypothetical protein